MAVPALLFVVDWLSRFLHAAVTEFLLVPPLAVIIYLIFSHPQAPSTNFRSVVILPSIGATVGELAYRYCGLTPWGVALATLVVLSLQELISADMPPALALAVLAMLLGARGFGYTAGVATAALIVWTIFLIWRRLVFERLT